MIRATALAAAFLLWWMGTGAAATVCAAGAALSSPQDTALVAFAARVGLRFPDAFRALADYLHADDGRALPDCYLTKRTARSRRRARRRKFTARCATTA